MSKIIEIIGILLNFVISYFVVSLIGVDKWQSWAILIIWIANSVIQYKLGGDYVERLYRKF